MFTSAVYRIIQEIENWGQKVTGEFVEGNETYLHTGRI